MIIEERCSYHSSVVTRQLRSLQPELHALVASFGNPQQCVAKQGFLQDPGTSHHKAKCQFESRSVKCSLICGTH